MLKSNDKTKQLVIGLGNEYRGDDALGIEVIRVLRESYSDMAEYLTESSDILRMIDKWEGRNVTLIDAVRSKRGQVGRIHQIRTVRELNQQTEIQFSTHGLGIREALEISASLSKAPKSIFFIGVEGVHWEIGSQLSTEIEAIIPQVVHVILRRLRTD